MTQPSEMPTEPGSWNPADWVVYARDLAERLSAAKSALAEKERELESLREKLEELPEEPEHFTEWRKAPLANSETLRYIDALRAYVLSLRGREGWQWVPSEP